MKDQKLKAIKKTKPTLGYSDISTVKLDFDNKTYRTTKYWAQRINRFFKLNGFLILKSSTNHYHIVFNRTVSWALNVHIMNWASLQVEGKKLGNLPLTNYANMQGIKESSCLRCGRKGEKPFPRIVLRFVKQDREIKNFLKYRRIVKSAVRRVEREKEQ